MYVTLEPCTHHGKTPPCTDAIIAAGVKRVVIATRDPNPLARGGVEKLRAAGIEVEVGTESAAALELNAAFFNSFASDRPWVTLKLALSADGAIADPTGQRRWITGPESRAEVHRMRAGVDAIAVGIGTVLADDPELTVRDAPSPRRQPTRVIFDSRLRMPLDSAIVESASRVPTVIVATPRRRRADSNRCPSAGSESFRPTTSLGWPPRAPGGGDPVAPRGGWGPAGRLLSEREGGRSPRYISVSGHARS